MLASNDASSPPTSSAKKILYWALLLLAILPWLYMRVLQPGHHDILWLCVVMERILDGLTMSGSAYETNPPLSMLTYFFPAVLHKYLGLSTPLTTLVQSFAIFGACAAMFHQALKNFAFLTDPQRLILLFSYMLAATIGSQISFGERDHYIALLLPPFVLYQLAITQKTDTHRRCLWPFMLVSAVLILVKPHHGLLPALMLLHRAVKTRSLSFLKDPDFLSLSSMTILYAAVVWFFFRDYIDVVAPDVMKYYFMHIYLEDLLSYAFYALMMVGLIWLGIHEFLKKSQLRSLLDFLVFCGAASLIPVLVQAKGFYYHYTPMVMLLACAGGVLLYEVTSRFSATRKMALPGTVIALALIGYCGLPLKFNFPDYTPLEKVINEANKDAEHKSFWVYDDMMDMGQEMHVSTGAEYGSRFASTWFLSKLYKDMTLNPNQTPAEKEATYQDFLRFSGMMAEDLDTFKPNVVLILSSEFFKENYDIEFDLAKFLSQNPVYKKSWKKYAYAGKVTYEETSFYEPLTYKNPQKIFYIYKRRELN